MTDYDRSRAIYAHLASTKRFSKTKEHCQCLGCSTLEVLSHAGAHCITMATAFVALCRLQGIPARLACGALAGYPVGEGRYELSTRNEPLFGHTWAQIHTQAHGWIPVEFHGIVIGAQAMTNSNVSDSALRAHIVEQGPAYRDYYFGNLDCHRLHCSNAVRSIPQVLALPGNAEAQARAVPPVGLQYECTLSFEYA